MYLPDPVQSCPIHNNGPGQNVKLCLLNLSIFCISAAWIESFNVSIKSSFILLDLWSFVICSSREKKFHMKNLKKSFEIQHSLVIVSSFFL